MSMTIDLTPTYAESARICAYWLASHSEKSPDIFLGGDYWTESPIQQRVAVATFNKVDRVAKAMEDLDYRNQFHNQSKTFKSRVIMSALAKAQAEYLETF